MTTILPTFLRLCMVLGLVAALAGTGFAHRLGTPAPDADLLAFQQAGGSLADICGQDGPSHSASMCEACLLVSAALVPTSDTQIVALSQFSTGVRIPMPQDGAVAHHLNHAHAPRAPPIL